MSSCQQGKITGAENIHPLFPFDFETWSIEPRTAIMVEIRKICFRVIANESLIKVCDKIVPWRSSERLSTNAINDKMSVETPKINFLSLGKNRSKKKINRIQKVRIDSKSNGLNIYAIIYFTSQNI
jgi:hypothetical protein